MLRRQVEALAQAGVRDVTVVTGYRHEAVQCQGVTLVQNREWETSGEVASLMCVPDNAHAPEDQRTLVLYGDVLFDAELLRRLLATHADAAIVVDRSDARHDARDGKERDLVRLDAAPAAGRRFLANGSLRGVSKIGKRLDGAADGDLR